MKQQFYRKRSFFFLLIAGLLVIILSVSRLHHRYQLVGYASFYSDAFQGHRTANGESFNQNALTAAHRTLPFGTKVLVTNLENKRHVTVTINDRGPYEKKRIIDLSREAARRLGMIENGVAKVSLKILKKPSIKK